MLLQTAKLFNDKSISQHQKFNIQFIKLMFSHYKSFELQRENDNPYHDKLLKIENVFNSSSYTLFKSRYTQIAQIAQIEF